MRTRHAIPPLLALAALCTPAAAAQLPAEGVAEILSVSAARDGDQVIFELELVRPPDMATLSIERPGWQAFSGPWPRVPELRGEPVWQFPCYLEYQRPEDWRPPPPLSTLIFVGRCPAADEINLVLRYPAEKGVWRQTDLKLKLAGARPLPASPEPRQRWAAAQANWFALLRAHTRDLGGFYTYAEAQTRRQYDLPAAKPAPQPWRSQRTAPDEELYNVTTGALAVQESLQLDRMTNTERDRGPRDVLLADIPAVGVRSHPFDQMRGDQLPAHSELAKLVPQEFYYLHFNSLAKFYELMDFADRWGPSLLRVATAQGTDYGVRARLHEQFCLPETVLSRLLGPAVISELALLGSDPYLREGSDLTVLFRVSTRPAFQAAVDRLFDQGRQAHADALLDKLTYEGVPIERLVDPRRRVSCHRAWLGETAVYSNSLPALQRVIDVQAGRRASLADAPDFKYLRARVFPLDPQAEDGFLYLSDEFIRRLVGPELRIKEKRRLEAVTSLKLIANAALLYGYERGPAQPTLEELGLARVLDLGDLYDPEGGTFTWDAAAGVARSSTWGDLTFLTPLIEIPAERATARERDQYAQFRDRYQQYWRQYFDPIGVRIKVDRTIRVETCILPLIDLSAYNDFLDVAGGPPAEVRPERFAPGTLLRFIVHLNDGRARQQALSFLTLATGTNVASDWIGEWATFWVEDTAAFEKLVRSAYRDPEETHPDAVREVVDIFNASFVFGLHVKNKLSLSAFLVTLRSFIQSTAPNTVVFNNLEPYGGISIVQIAPDPSGELARELRGEPPGERLEPARPTTAPVPGPDAPPPATAPVSERGPAVYYATIGDGFYVATQAGALRRLIEQRAAEPPASPAPPLRANVALFAAPAAAELLSPTISFVLEQGAREATVRNMTQVWLLGRCGVLARLSLDEAAQRYLGYRLVCPDGGSYRYEPRTVEAVSTIHGPLSSPRRLDALPEGSPLADVLSSVRTILAGLRFTEDGVTTTLEIQRP